MTAANQKGDGTSTVRARRIASLGRRSFMAGVAGSVAVAMASQAFRMQAHAYEIAMTEGLRALAPREASTFEAIAARIWPGSEDDPGAREGGAVYFLDTQLAGRYADDLTFYKHGLELIDVAAQARHEQNFSSLSEEDQDALLSALENDDVEEFDWPSGAEFFERCRTHTLQGMFADPIHGGNRDFHGWRAVGYPGAHYVYSEAEQQSFEPLDKPLQSVADL